MRGGFEISGLDSCLENRWVRRAAIASWILLLLGGVGYLLWLSKEKAKQAADEKAEREFRLQIQEAYDQEGYLWDEYNRTISSMDRDGAVRAAQSIVDFYESQFFGIDRRMENAKLALSYPYLRNRELPPNDHVEYEYHNSIPREYLSDADIFSTDCVRILVVEPMRIIDCYQDHRSMEVDTFYYFAGYPEYAEFVARKRFSEIPNTPEYQLERYFTMSWIVEYVVAQNDMRQSFYARNEFSGVLSDLTDYESRGEFDHRSDYELFKAFLFPHFTWQTAIYLATGSEPDKVSIIESLDRVPTPESVIYKLLASSEEVYYGDYLHKMRYLMKLAEEIDYFTRQFEFVCSFHPELADCARRAAEWREEFHELLSQRYGLARPDWVARSPLMVDLNSKAPTSTYPVFTPDSH